MTITHRGRKMEATNIIKNIGIGAAMFMATTLTFAQSRGGHDHDTGSRTDSYQIATSARSVAQSARSLKMSLEMMNGQRRGDRSGRGNGRGGRGGRGLFPIINAVQTVAQDARQVAQDASSNMPTQFSFRHLQRSFQTYQSLSVAIQNNPRLSFEVRSLNSSMSQLESDMRRQPQGQGNLQRVIKLTSRLARVTGNMAGTVSNDLRYRRYQTSSEREALRATSDLSSEASELERTAQNSRPALIRAKRQFETLRMTFRQAKRALRNITTSYTVSDQLQRAQEIVRKLAEELSNGRPGQGGNGHGNGNGNGSGYYDFN
jgi:hypothetical protein